MSREKGGGGEREREADDGKKVKCSVSTLQGNYIKLI